MKNKKLCVGIRGSYRELEEIINDESSKYIKEFFVAAPKEIKPGQSEVFKWKPLIYINGTSKITQLKTGTYRIVILYQIRKGSIPKDWKWNTVCSNEFMIKKKIDEK